VGVANCRVPSVVGKTLRAAKTAIARANCRVGRVGRRASASARGRRRVRNGRPQVRPLPTEARSISSSAAAGGSRTPRIPLGARNSFA
jgi:hypothetical protein